jgi:hypothetical protein
VDLVEETRARLPFNVSEDLACEALSYRLERRLATTSAKGGRTAESHTVADRR